MSLPLSIKIKQTALKLKRKIPNPFKKGTRQVYLRDRIGQYEGVWGSIADELGAGIEKLDRDIWQIKRGNKIIRARLHELPIDDNVVLKLCGRKPVVHRLLKEAGVPVPDYLEFNLSTLGNDVYSFLEKNPLGVVVKPCDGYSGLGVTTHIKTKKQLVDAAIVASLYLDQLMAEQQIPGENFRLLVYKGKLSHAVRRTGVRVIGDGNKSIQSLVSELGLSREAIKEDMDLSFTLSSKGITLEHVPKNGEQILVKSIASGFNGGCELRTIYDSEVTENIHPSIIRDVQTCSEVVKGNLLGVDIITTDITKNLREVGGVINEINTTPAFHHHYDEKVDRYPKIALQIVSELMEQ